MESEHRRIGVVSLSRNGAMTARRIREGIEGTHYTKPDYRQGEELEWAPSLQTWLRTTFRSHDAWILIMATGIAVRMIAPFLEDKYEDPAVVVVDEQGRFPISLVGGHMGGGNALTREVAGNLGVRPIITTATDGQGIESVDLFAKREGLILADRAEVTRATARQVNGQAIAYWDPGAYLGGHVTTQRPPGDTPVILIEHHPIVDQQVFCRLLPQNVVIGMGFRKQITGDVLFEGLMDFLESLRIDPRRVARVASIGLKTSSRSFADALSLFEHAHGRLETQTISTEAIAEVEERFTSSSFVRRTIGVGAVAGPCGYIASSYGEQVGETYRGKGMTFSCFIEKKR